MPEKPVKMENKPEKTVKTENNNQKIKHEKSHRRTSGTFPKKKDKFGRKRSQSFTGGNGKFCTPYICRKKPMLPTKFLLGGNICDPLNLNSLQDEEINRTVNAVTPKSSPIPTPPQRRGQLEVIIPPNIHDPLNLNCSDEAEYQLQLTSPLKKGTKRRKKKKRTSSATTEFSDPDISSASEAITPDKSIDQAKIPEIESDEPPAKLAKVTKDLKLELSPQKDKKRKSFDAKDVKKIRRLDSMDKIVSPVVPQPGAFFKRPLHNRNINVCRNRNQTKNNNLNQKKPQFKDKNKAYQYGNYNRYYGYRNPNHEVDPRLKCFANYRHLFEGKDILDIGCNIGHITLTIARDFGAKSIVGLDIDKKLIGIARKNVRHYVKCCDSPRPDQETQIKYNSKGQKCFPISMPILYGPVDIPGMPTEVKGKGFPHNVTFVQGNYVLADDTLLATEHTQFDVIMCLSVTKWLHLNWGDTGLKQAFRRMYAQLRPGGRLLLEPQSWKSYKSKKTLTETIYTNYNSIEFFPEKFTQYLLSSEVGFAKSEILGAPHHASKGFQRPIQIFTKSDLSPSQSQRSCQATPSYTITSASQASKNVYTTLVSPFPYYESKSEENTENLNMDTAEKTQKFKNQEILNVKMEVSEKTVAKIEENIKTEPESKKLSSENQEVLNEKMEIEKPVEKIEENIKTEPESKKLSLENQEVLNEKMEIAEKNIAKIEENIKTEPEIKKLSSENQEILNEKMEIAEKTVEKIEENIKTEPESEKLSSKNQEILNVKLELTEKTIEKIEEKISEPESKKSSLENDKICDVKMEISSEDINNKISEDKTNKTCINLCTTDSCKHLSDKIENIELSGEHKSEVKEHDEDLSKSDVSSAKIIDVSMGKDSIETLSNSQNKILDNT